MAGTGHLPRSGQGDAADFTNLENARLSNPNIAVTATLIGDKSRRTTIFLQNQSLADMYIGFDNTVTTSGVTRGIKLAAGEHISFNFAETIPLYAISSSGTQAITVVEAY